MHTIWKITSFIAISLLVFSGCEIINPEEPVPAYIYIPAFELETDKAIEGSNSHNIVDAWVFVNADARGLYELPARVPILEKGTPTIQLLPGITENGISSTRKNYPFYTSYFVNRDSTALTLQETKTDTIFPVVSYSDNVNFIFIEDFESSGINFEVLNGEKLLNKVSDERAKEGKSGAVELELAGEIFEIGTLEKFSADLVFGKPVYIELDYKNDFPLEVGLFGLSTNGNQVFYKLTLNETEEWKKVYINISEDVVKMEADNYQVIFRSRLPSNNDEKGSIYLDNLKVVTL